MDAPARTEDFLRALKDFFYPPVEDTSAPDAGEETGGSLTTGLEYLVPTGEGNERGQEYKLVPPPQVIEPEDVTMDVAYRALYCLQCDPEKVLFDGEAVEIPDRPPLSHVQEMMDLLVVNAEDYPIAEMHPLEVKILLATVTDYFIAASLGKWREAKSS